MTTRKILTAFVIAIAVSMNACAQSENTGKENNQSQPTAAEPTTRQGVKEINQDEFAQLVCDWQASEWNYKSTRPAVVDFNAAWCGPCRQLAPILQELAAELPEVDFYSINVDENRPLAMAFGVKSIPMLLVCPVTGPPTAIVGLHPKDDIRQAIKQVTGK